MKPILITLSPVAGSLLIIAVAWLLHPEQLLPDAILLLLASGVLSAMIYYFLLRSRIHDRN